MPTRNRTALRLAAVITMAATNFAAHAEQPLDVFVRAIGSGQASGEMTGRLSQRWKDTTRSESPLMMNAKVIKRFKQPGCARLDVVLRQENVPLRSGGTAPFQTAWQVNVCTDGAAPEEGRDEGSFARALSDVEPKRKEGQK